MPIAAWLDDIGKPAWIALMIVSFIVWWPLGLLSLGFLFWSGRMGCGYHGGMSWRERRERWQKAREEWRATHEGGSFRATGNTFFDDYRSETLKRLEEEQKEFSSFLDRLRRARDKAEFDQFISERGKNPPRPDETGSQPQH
jgi:hypothetical protein